MEKIKTNKYETSPYCYIKTNFNKNKEQRNEENVFNYFLNLMTQKMKAKGVNETKIKIIATDLWNKLKEEEKEKIRNKYNLKKKELKNNVIKTQVLKYIKRNSIKINENNKLDNEIQNMKLKTRLSKELQIAQFEDDLDELENKIKNILPKIEHLKETEKDEIELDEFINKQNSISDALKALVKEKITKENAKQIDEKKCKLGKEYLLFSEKMTQFLKRHEEKMKIYSQINEEGKNISEEINKKIKYYNEKKLDLKKELTNLIKKYQDLVEETKKLKLIEINQKCDKDVVKKQKEIHNNMDTIQKGLESIVENIKQSNEEMIRKQKEILPQEKFDIINKRQEELNNELNKLKENNKDYDDITEIIKEQNKFIKELESFSNNIKEPNLKENIELFKKYEKSNNKLAEKINNFQKNFLPKVKNFNEYIQKCDTCKKEIFDIYEKFKEKNIGVNESLDKLLLKIKDLYDETKKLKINETIEKGQQMKSNWEKIQEIYGNIVDKIKALVEKKGGTVKKSNDLNQGKVIKQNINKVDEKKMKEIAENINKEMIKLEESQKEIVKIFDKLKKDKTECVNSLNKILEEQENALKEIKSVYKDDIKNINKQNIKDNFEKYKQFNDKYRQIYDKIKKASEKCAALVKEYNDFAHKEFDIRKAIFEKANKLVENGIEIKEKNKDLVKKAEDFIEEIKKYNINELNEIFNKKINMKMKDINNIQELLVKLLKN
jgi:hypothetical protein